MRPRIIPWYVGFSRMQTVAASGSAVVHARTRRQAEALVKAMLAGRVIDHDLHETITEGRLTIKADPLEETVTRLGGTITKTGDKTDA
jgi:hypothetical protein